MTTSKFRIRNWKTSKRIKVSIELWLTSGEYRSMISRALSTMMYCRIIVF